MNTNINRTLLALLVTAVLLSPTRAQSPEDTAAIKATALDYIKGWYEGNADRMERALHPELAKRIVEKKRGSDEVVLDSMDAKSLIAATAKGGGKNTPPEKQQKDVTILDVFENAAAVKVVASGWVDYMQMAKWNGRWVIINVLWEMKPKAASTEPNPEARS